MGLISNQPSQAPCGMTGVACAGNCNCPGQSLAGGRGMGAFYETWPAPLNNPLVLAAIAVAVLLMFGGGLKIFGGRSSSGRRAKLRLIRAEADQRAAKLLAA
jgi:hypothetical protein